MMNQGGMADGVAAFDPNSLEKHQGEDYIQPHASSYYYPPSSSGGSWSMHGADIYTRDNGSYANANQNQDQLVDVTPRNAPDTQGATAVASGPSSVETAVAQDYSSYTSYTSADPYGYNNNAGYATYYNGYQQQPNQPYSQQSSQPYPQQSNQPYPQQSNQPQPYSQPVGAYQNTDIWSSTVGAAASQYQQHNKQWTDYYNQTQTENICAPGTENVYVPSTSTVSCPAASASSGYASSIQPSHFSLSSRPESSTSELTPQPVSASGDAYNAYWKHGAQAYQTQYSNFTQTSIDAKTSYQNSQYQQNSTSTQVLDAPYPALHQPPQSYQLPSQPASQHIPQLDVYRGSKLQIPTNPRIASNLALSLPKTNKESPATASVSKPAYISVALPKSNNKASPHDASDSALKIGMFPQSLRGYVERALARCRDDEMKMAASQAVMKEIITKGTADGTLFTKDWDTEPLFPLPTTDVMNEGSLFLTPTSSKSRSPSRRAKSRWEPVSEDKPINKPATPNSEAPKYSGWSKQYSVGKLENRHESGTSRFSLTTQKISNRDSQRPAKRRRNGTALGAVENGEASSDSDKEQDLTAYYSSAVALADSPDERKKRESRSKRFEKGHGNRSVKHHFKQKNEGNGNLYTRRATAMVLSKNLEENSSRAVEDIDWDSLTVRGTCQEIEKRYLRLTSAPDPATVRPEEVLEKSLLMVQNSEKNYLYKCDQLKSIRQDLTVQRIRNELTVKVYETHARLAIEVADLREYNQCQSQLQALYAEGIKGCHAEFAAYNLLCVILHSNNNRDLLSAMSSLSFRRLSPESRKDEVVKHALAVRAAVTSENYVLFFRLYKAAPDLNTCLMDLYVEKMRYAAVKCMSRSYRPTVPVTYIAEVLGFLTSTEANSEDLDGVDECVEWLKAHGGCLIEDNSGEIVLDAKASSSSLYVPEPEDAVPHGDAYLAVNDFFARKPV
ncbi:hypothetical protein Leryth_008270 [Lithospermum erythrorhizon]|nr:hypothetical protein Leryth_008270 [Lithospermum erythrorhizon]